MLGLYFAQRLFRNDSKQFLTQFRGGNYAVASLFTIALLIEALDIAVQCTVTFGIASGTGLVSLPASLAAAAAAPLAGVYGFAALPALASLAAMADKVSIASAAASCVVGVTAEAMKESAP